ncbi:response regulator transcription factor [Campylobacter sp. RM9344]|uniref:Response regulator transcription factor n=1 Tax=Campylobacter californiensis TaxID=1032243 RepID=A0AAW3ZXP9_9BACT|nr:MULTISPECIES: response regulator transcription factor [unclassified Campylobacter]MBE2985435.1 response regulator transcription factor [Campylobacter sp. RM6883]MBE2987244.1 response regulator transcription factor [Campylobacter sp. RM12919]MBE2988995.1 response regulator transcription factor [Campylobacter sp. RM12920]MBE2996013.1 response regulator transcription factor [Campylobacter sp. RM6913]MBE3030289.1 response regulator transcription factor [Campylobacter sp. RM9344]
MIRILLIEDDEALAKLIARVLEKENVQTQIALNPLDGLEILKSNNYLLDAIVLDLSLPDMDGLEVCALVRKTHPSLPIIISSARSQTLDKIKGFELGADDYIAKPYEPIELVFRLRAILRRGITVVTDDKIFTIDVDKHILYKNGKILELPLAEYDIFAFLFEKEGFAVSREDLLLSLSSIKFQSGLKSIDVLVGRLRSRIGDSPKNPRFIHSVRGVGYKFINA